MELQKIQQAASGGSPDHSADRNYHFDVVYGPDGVIEDIQSEGLPSSMVSCGVDEIGRQRRGAKTIVTYRLLVRR